MAVRSLRPCKLQEDPLVGPYFHKSAEAEAQVPNEVSQVSDDNVLTEEKGFRSKGKSSDSYPNIPWHLLVRVRGGGSDRRTQGNSMSLTQFNILLHDGVVPEQLACFRRTEDLAVKVFLIGPQGIVNIRKV